MNKVRTVRTVRTVRRVRTVLLCLVLGAMCSAPDRASAQDTGLVTRVMNAVRAALAPALPFPDSDELGSLPVVVLRGGTGLAVTLGLLLALAGIVLAVAGPGKRAIPGRWIVAALLMAVLAVLNLVVSGQPWGVVYGLGLWGAKAAAGLGVDLSRSAFWAAPGNAARVGASVLTDVTSLTAFGSIIGAMLVAFWRGGLAQPLPRLPARAWIATVVSGLLLGYSSRLAFGCNVGALFSGISTGSLHGWAWLVLGFAGSVLGVRLRTALWMEGRP